MVGERDVRLPSRGRSLAATLVTPDAASGAGVSDGARPSAAVLLVHGLGSDRLTNVERGRVLAERLRATCLAVDLAGHGASPGRLSEVTPRQNLDDVVAAFDALCGSAGVDPGRVAVAAASYGAYLSVLLTEQRNVARLVLRAPALYTDASLDRPLGRRGRPVPAEASLTRAVRVLGRYRGPVLVVSSEHDEVVPPWVVQAYVEARPGVRHAVLAGAGHALTDPSWRAGYTDLVASDLETL